MQTETGIPRQPIAPTEEASPQTEDVSGEKMPITGILGPFRGIRHIVGRAIFQAYSTMQGFPQDALHGPTDMGRQACVVSHLASWAEIDNLIQDTKVRLAELQQLPEDWYIHGANRIANSAVQRATTLVSSLSTWHGVLGGRIKPEGVIPMANGGVELLWRGSQGTLEVLIHPDNEVDYEMEIGQGLIFQYEDGDVSVGKLPILLNRIA